MKVVWEPSSSKTKWLFRTIFRKFSRKDISVKSRTMREEASSNEFSLQLPQILRAPTGTLGNSALQFLDWPLDVRHKVSVQFSSVAQSCPTLCDQHARPPCPSPTPGVHSNSCSSRQWCHSAISSSVVPFSSCPQSLPDMQMSFPSESFPMSQLFTWGGQSTGVSGLALFLPKNTQGWSPLEWTGWISLQSKGFSRVFSNTVQKHQFFSTQLSSQSNCHIHTWPQEKP